MYVKTKLSKCQTCDAIRPIAVFAIGPQGSLQCDKCRKAQKRQKVPKKEYSWEDLRRARKLLLKKSDVTTVPDYPSGNIDWANLRQELRDLTKLSLPDAKKRVREIESLMAHL